MKRKKINRIKSFKSMKVAKADYHMMLFFMILLVFGFAMGLFLSKYIDIADKDSLNTYMSVLIDTANPNDFFLSQFMIGTLSIVLVVLLGTSLCGFPLISFLIYTKGVQIGFSCALFVLSYSYKGILGIMMVFLPQTFLDIVAFYVTTHFCLYFSMNLVHATITSATIPLKSKLNKLLNLLFVSFFLIFVSSYFKSTLGIELIRLFENL